MTNNEQADAYINKQRLIGQKKFIFYSCNDDGIEIQQNDEYTWAEKDEILVIPSFVTSIGDSAFEYNNVIRKVMFQNPDIISIIGHLAFKQCSRLEEIELPQNIKSINTATFIGCERLMHINIPNEVLKIHNDAFNGCKRLEKIEIDAEHSKLNAKGYNVFKECYSIKMNKQYIE